MIELLNTHFKKQVIIQYWDQEVKHNQRTHFDLAKELDAIGWYDEEIWTMIIDTAVWKKKVNNSYDFDLILNLMHKMNDPGCEATDHLTGKFDTQIEKFVERHYGEDRKWKYDLEARKLKTLDEMIEVRERSLQTDNPYTKDDIDESTIN